MLFRLNIMKDPYINYSFNKSHSIAYSTLSAWTTYLKFKYPQEFFLSLLKMTRFEPAPQEEISRISKELGYFKIKLLPPNLAKSDMDFKKEGEIGASHPKQFMNFDQMPYGASPAINLISLHPQHIEFSKALLGVREVHCYQSHTWLKYTGEADYDQAFHCDFGNHTLTVPSEQVAQRTVDFVIYLCT